MSNYLYNGVELPALPEWDKATYPYAVLWTEVHDPSGTITCIQVWASDRPFYYAPDTGYITTTAGSKYCAHRKLGSLSQPLGEWRPFGEDVTEKGLIAKLEDGTYDTETLVWANHDVYTPNGVLYLAASEPVPVEPETAWNGKDIYKRINGQWVKQDTYRRVGGEWKRQDEYQYE